jgi:YHS domain-containing protein
MNSIWLKHALLSLLLVCAALLAGCANVGQYGPYNTSAEGADSKLMLNGFDPVAYFTESKHTRGIASIKAEYDGVTYRFASAGNKAMFEKEPLKYVPQYGGFCANGIVYGIPWGGDGDTWRVINGKLYIFGGASSRNYFAMNEAANLKLADQYWANEVKGNAATAQRYKRLVLRVPHYKTGAELDAQWQKQQAQQAEQKK